MTASLFQPEGTLADTTLTLTARIIADADSIEISQGPRRLALYTWDDDRRTWLAAFTPVSGTTLYALLELARKVEGLSVVAWNDGKRLA
jgi:hypothetical protein